jgi:hypothetical protein
LVTRNLHSNIFQIMYAGTLNQDIICGIYGPYFSGVFPFYRLFHSGVYKGKALSNANFSLYP